MGDVGVELADAQSGVTRASKAATPDVQFPHPEGFMEMILETKKITLGF
jgi:hypothetical protein